ncbi:DUF397 domain-containing protein [Streptomyces avicenniae]|uniref:DUF397 domain-containing protein n=1 Tax=Streptomyces avicenniae TaxID=500153 RepID=UPI00069B2A20|nr:DUF397 domain-containing protein [Streptomyces avicenniae]
MCITSAWRKSTYSNGQGECAEVARVASAVGTRDTKDAGHGPEVWVSATTWAAFVGSVRRGGLDA